MIEISNTTAEEIIIVLGDLRRMAWNIPGNRAANMRRRARLIIEYLNKKKTIKTQNHERENREKQRNPVRALRSTRGEN